MEAPHLLGNVDRKHKQQVYDNFYWIFLNSKNES